MSDKPAIPTTSIVEVFKSTPQVKELTDKLQRVHDILQGKLEALKKPENDEDYEFNNAELALVKDQYGKMMALRKPITEQTDEFKEFMMQFERPFNPAATKTNLYLEKRKYQEEYQQKKIEEKQRVEREAAKKKELENLKVDIKAKILERLSVIVVEKMKAAEEYSKTLFDKLTVQIFDVEADKFRKQKPKLKTEDYDACFSVYKSLTDGQKQIISVGEFNAFVEIIKQEETYDKWNNEVQEKCAPILNEWRARIPQLKEELIARTNAQSEEERLALEEKKSKADAAAAEQRQKQFEFVTKQSQEQIQEKANLEKVGNELQAQAVVQQAGETGPTTLVLKFTSEKDIPKALMNIIFHCFTHPQFPGVQKRDSKTKKLLTDDYGDPIYIEPMQWWIDYFLKNCNASVDNTIISERAKITVRK